MPKPKGSTNFSRDEGERLKELAGQGLSKSGAAAAMRRSTWTIQHHSQKLGIIFKQRTAKPSKEARPDLADARASRREVEDRLIQEFARKGWTSGRAALEMDLDHSTIWRHSKRLGVTWTRYYNRSVRGAPVSGVAELRRLRAQVRRLSLKES